MATFTLNVIPFLKDGIISPEIAHEFSRKLTLQYIDETEAEGRVCFAADADVRLNTGIRLQLLTFMIIFRPFYILTKKLKKTC